MKKPRILIVVNVYPPDQCGGAVIFGDLARGLAERGYEVTVRCAYPYYPEWKNKSGENGLRIRRYTEHGVRVERFGLYIPRNPNALWERLLYEGSFFLSLARHLTDRPRFDAVMVICPLMGAVAYAALYGRLNRVPVWLNVQDLPADAAAAGGIAGRPGTAHLLQRIQSWLFNRTNLWSTISPTMRDRLQPLRRRGQPVCLLPNWLHRSLAETIARFPVDSPRTPHRPLRLFYSGNIGSKQDLLHFCKILHGTEAEFHFRIHGEGAEAADVRSWIEATGDLRFTFGGLLEEEAYARTLFDSDFLVVTEKSGTGGSFIPSKIIPAMAAGVPILAVSDPDSPLGREMHVAEPGPWFSWDTVRNIGNVLQDLSVDQYRVWQQQALTRAREYEREHVLDRYEEVLRDLLNLTPETAQNPSLP